MSSSVATIAASMIAASPGWALYAYNVRSQRRVEKRQDLALQQQTVEIKAHITAAAGPPAPGAPHALDPQES